MFQRNWAIAVAVAFTIFLSTGTPQAAVPSLVNYGGILTNGSGTPQIGTFNVTFAIYDSAVVGTQHWTEVQSVTTDAQGRFNVLLGASMALTEGIFSGPDRYLGTAVSPDPEMSPRTRISTVAYAFHAATLDHAKLDQYNTAVGRNAGAAITTGLYNTASGVDALSSNTTGHNNTAHGYQALLSNTTGGGNTANGLYALVDNTTGYSNSAFGNSSLSNNTTGYNNTAVGAAAMFWNTTGYANTASGVQALSGNTEGAYNTAIGYWALTSNTTGWNNTASGDDALGSNTTGSGNTATGVSALYSNIDGYGNTATGAYALISNTSGGSNTASGAGAMGSNKTGSTNTAIGSQAMASCSTGNRNTACGGNALYNNASGSNNTAIGFDANVTSGALTNATAIGAQAYVNASNKIRLGNTAVNVIEGQVAYTFTSDKNSKENFREVNGDEVLQKLRDLDVQSWNYKGHEPEHFRHYGPVAQDFYEAFGQDDVGTVGTPTTINSGDMAGILMIAVQALEKRTSENDELKARVEALEKLVREQLAAAKEQ